MKRVEELLMFGMAIWIVGGCGGEKKITGPNGQEILVWEEKYGNGKTKFKYEYYIDNADPPRACICLGGFSGIDVTHFKANENHVFAGFHKVYKENGTPIMGANFNDGVPVGKWVDYYDNGKVRLELNYKNGPQDGKWVEYHEVQYYENGKRMYEGNYKNAGVPRAEPVSIPVDPLFALLGGWPIEDGKFVWYDENGNITSERTYDNGTCTSGC